VVRAQEGIHLKKKMPLSWNEQKIKERNNWATANNTKIKEDQRVGRIVDCPVC
jgi:hypothetical protein